MKNDYEQNSTDLYFPFIQTAKIGLFLLLAILSPSGLFGQPANETPCSAEVVTPDGSCVMGTTDLAQAGIEDPACGGPSMVDVFYEVTLSLGMDELTIDFTNINIPGNGILMTNVYSFVPDCSGTFSLVPGGTYCGAPTTLNFLLTGLTGGATYYIQIGSTPFNSGDFNICFTENGPAPCPSADACGTAELIPYMGQPACVNGCNAGAAMGPLGQAGCFNFPNETVWYTFNPIPVTGGAPPWSYSITVTSDDLLDPQVAVFQNCNFLTPLACETGANGMVNLSFASEDYPIDIYYIAVSDANGGSGQFEICYEPFAYLDCNTESNIQVVSTSYGSPLSGPFLPTEQVEICLNIENFNSGDGTGCNFLHGIKPSFGDGWDFNASFLASGEPSVVTTPLTNNSNIGGWEWFGGFGSPTYNLPNGPYPQGSPVGNGWFYTRNPNTCTTPGCSRGDGNDPLSCVNNNIMQWQVCFVLTVKPWPACDEPPVFPFFWDNTDLSVSFETFGDSETGSNTQPGCWEDESWELDLTVNCCAPPIVNPAPPQVFCTPGTVVFPLTSNQDPDVEYTWTVSPNNLGATECTGGCPTEINQVLTNTSFAPETVTYTVSVVNTTGCFGSDMTFQATVYPGVSLTMVPPVPVCEGECTTINTFAVGGSPPYSYVWSSGGGQNNEVCPMETTTYSLTVTDQNGCSVSDEVEVTINELLTVDIIANPGDMICSNADDFPIQLSAQVSSGGSGLYTYNWDQNLPLETIDADESGLYLVTVTDAFTQCSGESSILITVNEPPVAFIEEIEPICNTLNDFCFTGSPGGGIWSSNDVIIDPSGCIVPSGALPGMREVCYTYQDPLTLCDSTVCLDFEITAAPVLDDIEDVSACNTFTLEEITGTNLTGNELYYDGPGGSGNAYSPGDEIGITTTFYAYDDDGSGICNDEISFTVTINSQPDIFPVEDITTCGVTELPVISGDNLSANVAYFDGPGGTGNSYLELEEITQSGQYYIYDDGGNGECTDEVSIMITITPEPDIDPLEDVSICNAYTLPEITGSDLTGNQAYFDGAAGTGNSFAPNDIITSSIQLYLYDDDGSGNCGDEETFIITIIEEPDLDPIPDVNSCDSYTLPAISGSSLTGNQAYFDGPSGTGNSFAAGEVITQSIQLYAYDDDGSGNCNDEEAFMVTITPQPDIDPLEDVIACDSYTLQTITGADLTGNEAYFDGPGGTGNTFAPNDVITASIQLYLYDDDGSGNCGDEETFMITITPEPDIDPFSDVTNCDSYTLPAITGFNLTGNQLYFDGPNGTGNSYSSGEVITQSIQLYAFDDDGSGNCGDEEVFNITINPTPTSSFTVASPICEINASTITYTGSASLSGTYNWNFNGGTILSGSGQGPYQIQWNAPGSYNVSLTVVENGCSSNVFNQLVQVDEQLAPPVINCNSTTGTVEFTWNDVNGATGYTVNVLNGPVGTQAGNTYSMSGLNPGEVVEIEVIAIGNGSCGNSTAQLECTAQDCPPIQITIDPVADICLEANATSVNLNAIATNSDGSGNGSWAGPGTNPAGVFDPLAAGIGNHLITYTFVEANCTFTESTTIEVIQQPTADFTLDGSICETETATITYQGNASLGAAYNWNFAGGTIISGTGAGPYQISWPGPGNYNVSLQVIENTCSSEQFNQNIQVAALLAEPVINCNTTTGTINFSWADVPGATGYQVNLISGPSGTQNGNNYDINGLQPGESVTIEVIALGNAPCGNSSAQQTCIAEDCPPISLVIDPVNDLCFDINSGNIQLTANEFGSDGSGTGSWSGTATNASGIFDPASAGEGVHTITYDFTEAGCDFSETIDITIFATPSADFQIESPACEDDPVTIIYNGSASNGANFNWNFDGATIISGTGSGPFEVSWPTAGNHPVTLTVEENGCSSPLETASALIEQALNPPVISCNSTTGEIEFSWNDVQGASGYAINVISGPSGTLNGTSYTVTGLQPNDNVTIEVIALNNGPCGNSTATQTCTAMDCPPISLIIDPVADICLDASAQPVNLNVTVSGGDGSGNGSWDNGGTFDPSLEGPGIHTVTYTFTEANCTFSESIDIEVIQAPTANFVADNLLCFGENSIFNYTGSAASGAIYNWDFNGGTILNGSGSGPYEIEWPSSGVYTISLSVEENNCTSAIFTEQIQIEEPLAPPVINCNTTTTSIEFSWDPVAGATGYEVNVISGASGTLNGTSYTVNGLQATDEVIIEVIAQGTAPCGDVSSIQSCTASDCPAINLSIDPENEICKYADAELVDLAEIISGSDGSGSGVWSGPGIIDSNQGIFDPNDAGVNFGQNQITYTFTEQACTFTANTTIIVNEIPIAEAGTGDELSCTNVIVTLDGSASASGQDIDYTWSGPGPITNGNSTSPQVESPGFYYLTVSNTLTGCFSVDSVEVTQDADVPIAIAGEDMELTCNVPELNLQGDGSMGANFMYEWQGPGITPANMNEINPLIDVAGTYVLIVTDLNNNCESSPDTVVIGDNTTAPIVIVDALGATNIDCNANSVLLDGSGSSTTDVIYQWLDPNGDPIPGASTLQYEAMTAGTYTLSVVNTLSGCTAAASYNVIDSTTDPQAEAGPAQQLDCTISSVSLDGSGSESGPNITYTWDGPAGGISGSNTTLVVNATLPGIYTITVQDTSNGCFNTATVIVSEDLNGPTANAGPDMEFDCDFTPLTLDGSGSSTGPDFTYQWFDPAGNSISNSITAQVETTGMYQLVVTDNNNDCVDTAFVTLTEQSNVPYSAWLSTVDPSCFGENDASIQIDSVFGGTAAYVYTLDGENFYPYNQFTQLEAGTYQLSLQDAAGCEWDTTIVINNPPEVNIDLGPDIFIQMGDSAIVSAEISIAANRIDTIIWTPFDELDCLDPICFEIDTDILETTQFTATVLDVNGCQATAGITVFVRKDRLVFIPTAFSPNNDGSNDLFMIHTGLGVSKINAFRVFSRWGEMVHEAIDFQPNDPGMAWDGRFKGQDLNQAVFVYVAEIEMLDGTTVVFKGDVTLLK